MSPRPLPLPGNPALRRHAEERGKSLENRADDKRQVLADQEWQTVQQEERQNEELLKLSNEILELTKAIHTTRTPNGPNGT